MRIGISVSSSLTADTPARAAAMIVERAAAAYRSGLASLSVGDHHAQPHWYQQNTPTLGRLLAEWPDRPAGCLFLLPLWHPLLVAEHVGTLAAHVDAPFIVQTGIGTGRAQFASMGADLGTRGRDIDESIRVVQLLLAGESAESEQLGLGPTTLGLRPAQPVEWWIGGHAAAALQRAARVGTAWYGGPGLSVSEAAALIRRYEEACADEGTTPRSIVRRDALVLGDGTKARAAAEAIVERGYRAMTMDQLLVGGPSEAESHLQELAAVGVSDVIIRCMTLDQAQAVETIEVLGALSG